MNRHTSRYTLRHVLVQAVTFSVGFYFQRMVIRYPTPREPIEEGARKVKFGRSGECRVGGRTLRSPPGTTRGGGARLDTERTRRDAWTRL